LDDPFTARLKILERKNDLLEVVHAIDPVLSGLGGGAYDVEVHLLEDTPIGSQLVVHLIYDVRDAMGANAINTACEKLSPMIEEITGGRVLLRILSNLADRRLARTRCTIPLKDLAFENYSAEDVRDGIIAAWAFAAADPYRAATHNKGIMNGIDSVIIATGNDFRAVEAGAHSYAARTGSYKPLTTFEKTPEGDLVGTIELPMAVGLVGGATKVHPTAKACVKLLGVKSAQELGEIAAAVGLAQNLAALRALATVGIQRGHMTLHAKNIVASVGCPPELVDEVCRIIIAEKKIRMDRALEVVEELRRKRR